MGAQSLVLRFPGPFRIDRASLLLQSAKLHIQTLFSFPTFMPK